MHLCWLGIIIFTVRIDAFSKIFEADRRQDCEIIITLFLWNLFQTTQQKSLIIEGNFIPKNTRTTNLCTQIINNVCLIWRKIRRGKRRNFYKGSEFLKREENGGG